MGCLKSIIKKIILLLLIVAFFAFGGWTFVKGKIKEYQNPPREEFIKTEKSYADFSGVSSDYQLSRSFNLFGYKKLNAKYLPTGQKITILDLKNEDKVCESDFKTGEIDSKISNLLDITKDSIITFEDFEILEKGVLKSKNKDIPYVKFASKVKNVPFKNVIGIIAVYSSMDDETQNQSSKLIFTITDKKAYNPVIVKNFAEGLKI